MTVVSATYNEANQMLTFQPENDITWSMTYDENGNLTSVTNSCGTTTYTWDARNRLVAIEGFDKNCNPLSTSFKYDALGRRIEKTINGRTIQYLYDGLDIIQEIENGMVTVNYIRTLNIDEPLVRIEAEGTIRYYHADALGSIIALTDDLGNVRTQYDYSPFGETEILGEPSDNPFQYTGRENDGTGLYYYRARYYSPKLKRFISEDPIGFAGGINFYVYVKNSPLNFRDPFGLYCTLVNRQIVNITTSTFEKIVYGDWIYDGYQQINVFCICFYHRDKRIDVTVITKILIKNIFKCVEKGKCGKTRTYYKTEFETQEKIRSWSKYGGREFKRIWGTMYSGPGEGLESGAGCDCEPLGPPPPGFYEM